MLLLVHSRTLAAPLDTVRALSPGRGRQSSAQGFTFSTAGGDTSPGSLPHLSPSHSLVGSPRSASLAREKSLGLPPQIVFASWILIASPRPTTFFLGLQIGSEAEGKMFSSSFTMSEQEYWQWTLYKLVGFRCR
jgi:hypothetical protein